MVSMQAIILAAGVGERLGAAAGGRPKALLDMGGSSLLERHCSALRALGVNELHVITGYRADLIGTELDALPDGDRIRRTLNPDFRLGSVMSLRAAGATLRSGGTVIVMDADVLYDARVLETLIRTQKPNCFLLDRDFEIDDEPVKLCVRNGHIVEFRKHVPRDLKFDLQGESVGFFRFAPDLAATLADRCDEYAAQGRQGEPYEEAIRDLVLLEPGRFGYEEITGLPWIEIDFPVDIARARNKILPRLTP